MEDSKKITELERITEAGAEDVIYIVSGGKSYQIKTSDFKEDLSNFFNITTGDADDITEGANNKFLLQAEREKLGYVDINLNIHKVGSNAGENYNGVSLTASGTKAASNADGSGITATGLNAARNAKGNGITVVGANAGRFDLGNTLETPNSTAIGVNTVIDKANQVVIGNADVTELKIGETLVIDKEQIVNAAEGLLVTKKVGGKTVTEVSDVLLNIKNDYPIKYDSSAPITGGARDFIIDAKVFCNKKYRVNFAYINRTTSNTGFFDNLVGINIFNIEGEPEFNQLEYFRRDGKLAVGTTGVYTANYEIPSLKMKIAITYKLDKIPNGINNLGHFPQYPFYNKMPFMDYVYYPLDSNDLKEVENKQTVKREGENLYIGSKFNENKDLIIHFRRCMFNNLMTFFKVGLSDNTNINPLTNPNRTIDETLNEATSDNIGPMFIRNGGWTGGNHSWQEAGFVKTAKTLSYKFYADGVEILNNEEYLASKVAVVVKNIIYDPRTTPESGSDILSTELCTEDVIYTIENGSVFVSLSHTFKNQTDVFVKHYYGMQSMFTQEASVMTPNGLNIDFENNPLDFTKQSHPTFNRFVEKNANADRYQSTFLLNDLGIGDHNLLDNDENIFRTSGNKTYHNLISEKTITNNTVNEWNGFYNWFDAFLDNDEALIYKLDRNAYSYLFVDLKKAVNKHLDIPREFKGKSFTIKEQSDTINSVGLKTSALGLKVESTGSGSLVLIFKN